MQIGSKHLPTPPEAPAPDIGWVQGTAGTDLDFNKMSAGTLRGLD